MRQLLEKLVILGAFFGVGVYTCSAQDVDYKDGGAVSQLSKECQSKYHRYYDRAFPKVFAIKINDKGIVVGCSEHTNPSTNGVAIEAGALAGCSAIRGSSTDKCVVFALNDGVVIAKNLLSAPTNSSVVSAISAATANVDLLKDASAKAVDERNQQVALAQAENLRLAAELSKLREQLSNQGGVQAAANTRKALIIGNDSYRSVAPLVNARADARLISENLSMFGYAVTLKMDLTEKQMKEALRVFKGQVNPGDEVAIFYAGHGVQLGSANYLLPVDVGGDNEEQVRDEAISLQRILDDMTDKKAKFTLAMIDACRDNPFKSSGRSIGGTRGLTVTSAATGQMVIFSAGTGQLALDKLGPADKVKNGLFTRVFAEQMKVAGASINNVMRNVRNEVARLAKTIGHDQVPAIYDQVLGDFYFSN